MCPDSCAEPVFAEIALEHAEYCGTFEIGNAVEGTADILIAGDGLLLQVAQRGLACIRDSDTLARLGGDEFLCVLPNIDGQQAAEDLAQRFVDAMNQPFTLRDGVAHIGASVGIAMYPLHGTTVDQLIEFADAALYFAKHAGRNVYRVFQVEDAGDASASA